MLTYGSLFAGIGGFDLGFESVGLRCAWQVEIDPYAQQVLAKHWPQVRRHDDVRTFPPTAPEEWRVDLACGGFPCQDISLAGRGAGIDGERSGLWTEYARIIGVVRPRYVIVENVAAIAGRGLGRVLGDLSQSGYDACWDCLPAIAFSAPHLRDRLFLLAWDANRVRCDDNPFHAYANSCRFAWFPQPDVGSIARLETSQRHNAGGLRADSGGVGADAQGVGWNEVQRRSSRSGGQSAGVRAADGQIAPGANANSQRQAVRGQREDVPAANPGGTLDRGGSGVAPGKVAVVQTGQVATDTPSGQSGQLRRLQCPQGREEEWHLFRQNAEPPVPQVAARVPHRLDRLRGTGNSVLPQIAAWLGAMILHLESKQ